MRVVDSERTEFVILLESEAYCIGPFDELKDAKLYKDSDGDRDEMRVMQIVAPAECWREYIDHSGEAKTRGRVTTDRSRRRARMSKA